MFLLREEKDYVSIGKFNEFLGMIVKRNKVKKVLYVRDEIFAEMRDAKIERQKHSAADDKLACFDGKSRLLFSIPDMKYFDDSYAKLGYGLYSITFKSGANVGFTF